MRTKYLLTLLAIPFMMMACSEPASVDQGDNKDSLPGTVGAGKTSNDKTVRPDVQGNLLLTAETGIPSGPEIKYMEEWKAFGWFGGKDQVIWDIDNSAEGTYQVFMEWSVAPEEAGKAFLLSSNIDSLVGNVKSTGSWETFTTEKIGELKLSRGTGSIVFKPHVVFDKGAILDLRSIKLVPVK